MDGDGTLRVLGGSLPGDLVGRASGDLLIVLGLVDRVEVCGLGEGGRDHGHEGGSGGEETHLELFSGVANELL